MDTHTDEGDSNVQGDLSFSVALENLKGNVKMIRSGWNGKGMYVQIQRPDEHSANTLPYLFLITVTGDRVPWLASQTDLLAEDWYTAAE